MWITCPDRHPFAMPPHDGIQRHSSRGASQGPPHAVNRCVDAGFEKRPSHPGHPLFTNRDPQGAVPESTNEVFTLAQQHRLPRGAIILRVLDLSDPFANSRGLASGCDPSAIAIGQRHHPARGCARKGGPGQTIGGDRVPGGQRVVGCRVLGVANRHEQFFRAGQPHDSQRKSDFCHRLGVPFFVPSLRRPGVFIPLELDQAVPAGRHESPWPTSIIVDDHGFLMPVGREAKFLRGRQWVEVRGL